jgi:hypothetical protein
VAEKKGTGGGIGTPRTRASRSNNDRTSSIPFPLDDGVAPVHSRGGGGVERASHPRRRAAARARAAAAASRCPRAVPALGFRAWWRTGAGGAPALELAREGGVAGEQRYDAVAVGGAGKEEADQRACGLG